MNYCDVAKQGNVRDSTKRCKVRTFMCKPLTPSSANTASLALGKVLQTGHRNSSAIQFGSMFSVCDADVDNEGRGR